MMCLGTSLFALKNSSAAAAAAAAFLSFQNRHNIVHKRHPYSNFRYARYTPYARNSKSKRYLNSFGLTDDGDFAILGVNVDDTDDDDETTIPRGQSLDGDLSSLLSGTIFVTETRSSASSSAVQSSLLSSTESIMGQRPDIADEKDSNNIHYATNNEALGEIMEYLVEIMPTISEDDIESYAAGLGNIGFHPKCITMCELKLEDLDFMKVLHRRYFFNEVTGVEHPWEV